MNVFFLFLIERPKSYWGTTGSIFELFQDKPENLSLIKDIINKGSYYRLPFSLSRILDSVSLEAIRQEPVLYLFFSGYLAFDSTTSDSDDVLLKIPNEEIRSNFEQSIYKSISSIADFSNEVQKYFLTKEIKKIEECLIKIFIEGVRRAKQNSPKRLKGTDCPLEIYINNEVWRLLKELLNDNFIVDSQMELDIVDNMKNIMIRKPDIAIRHNSKNRHVAVYLIENTIIENDSFSELEKTMKVKQEQRKHEGGDYQKEASSLIVFWVGVNKLERGNRVIVKTEVIAKQKKKK